ncbi:MAG: hypothetical protein JXO72_09030 [Vicinamibacteria bacterium]|nr:hypothetical protein [Vicinamibacteria bacterium]
MKRISIVHPSAFPDRGRFDETPDLRLAVLRTRRSVERAVFFSIARPCSVSMTIALPIAMLDMIRHGFISAGCLALASIMVFEASPGRKKDEKTLKER